MIGSVYASLYASRLAERLPGGLPTTIARTAHESLGSALMVAGRIGHRGHPALAAAIHEAATSAFFDGVHAADWVSAGITAAGGLIALALLPAHPTSGTGDAPWRHAFPSAASAATTD